MIRMSAALVISSRTTTALVAFDCALSRLGCTRTVSAIAVDNTLCLPGLPGFGGRAGTGRQSRFRSWCSKERGGSSPSARMGIATRDGLVLRPDELVHGRDAHAVGDRDISRVRLGPPNVEHVAVVAEDAANVVRQIREEVARIFVGRNSPTR